MRLYGILKKQRVPRSFHLIIIFPINSIIGARQTGKTTLLNTISEHLGSRSSNVYTLTLEDPELLSDLNQPPRNLFHYIPKRIHSTFVLLDEIQYLKDPSGFLKYHYDLSRDWLKIVATWSSAFYIDEKFRDSLAGRKRLIELYPFCFSEFLKARSESLLSAVVANQKVFLEKRQWLKPYKRDLYNYWVEYSMYGGYPKVVLEDDPKEKVELLKDLALSFLKKDIRESGVKQEDKFFRLVRILASQSGQLVNANELANTIQLSQETVNRYLYVLRKSYIIKLYAPFHRNVRKELTKMPKVFFLDSGLRNYFLNSFQRIEERVDAGATLENNIFSEMTKSGFDNVKFWRTQDQREVDFIVNDAQAFEVKVSGAIFRPSRHQAFQKAYPDIPLRPVVMQDDQVLDVLDFVT